MKKHLQQVECPPATNLWTSASNNLNLKLETVKIRVLTAEYQELARALILLWVGETVWCIRTVSAAEEEPGQVAEAFLQLADSLSDINFLIW